MASFWHVLDKIIKTSIFHLGFVLDELELQGAEDQIFKVIVDILAYDFFRLKSCKK